MTTFNISPSATTRHVADAASAAQILASVLTKHQADFGPSTTSMQLTEINDATIALLRALDGISFSCVNANAPSGTNLSRTAGRDILRGNAATQAVCAEMQAGRP